MRIAGCAGGTIGVAYWWDPSRRRRSLIVLGSGADLFREPSRDQDSIERRLLSLFGRASCSTRSARQGRQAMGVTTRFDGKYSQSGLSPPSEVRADKPFHAGRSFRGLAAQSMGARNPLAGGEYAIHGTTRRFDRRFGSLAASQCLLVGPF